MEERICETGILARSKRRREGVIDGESEDGDCNEVMYARRG